MKIKLSTINQVNNTEKLSWHRLHNPNLMIFKYVTPFNAQSQWY